MPFPCSLVVKNGSKMRARVVSSIPWPVSPTAIITYRPGSSGTCGFAYDPWRPASAVSLGRRPHFGIASAGGDLEGRLATTDVREWESTCLHHTNEETT